MQGSPKASPSFSETPSNGGRLPRHAKASFNLFCGTSHSGVPGYPQNTVHLDKLPVLDTAVSRKPGNTAQQLGSRF